MTDEILKLAKECKFSVRQWEAMFRDVGPYEITKPRPELEAFYRAAFNTGLEAAAKSCLYICNRARPSPSSHAYQKGAIDCANQIKILWR